jgi:hypothetical protein
MEDDNRESRLIRMPPEVWVALDQDAARCRRSSTRQLEAVLVAYYGLEDVNLKDLSSVPGSAQYSAARAAEAANARPVQLAYPEPLRVPVLGDPGPRRRPSKQGGKSQVKTRKRG